MTEAAKRRPEAGAGSMIRLAMRAEKLEKETRCGSGEIRFAKIESTARRAGFHETGMTRAMLGIMGSKKIAARVICVITSGKADV